MSNDRVALITGTSTGIGLATAVQAARAGFRTVATLRNPARADRLRKAAADAGVELDIRPLDVTDATSVRTAFEGVLADYGRLDVLVNNAGAGHIGTIEQEPVSAVRETMEVNFFGVVEATKAALPALRASSGRLITVSSVGGVIGQPFNEAYCAAKFAVEGMMEALAPVAAAQGVTVCVVEPGAVATEFVNNVGLDERLFTEAGPYTESLRSYIASVTENFQSAQTADEVAAVILDAMTADAPAFRIQTSKWAEDFAAIKFADRDGSAVQRMTAGWLA
ncbi:SDR family NAD(P)-dependent oxidoreductase [Amycolatopsis balhimycina DSM 5908]|uniref:SDR family NAD(P)-dependent oxidoreductase n=1 Tax=Amycolatopsis balhimycina DSM 5908 TaxID=1081091 RepID=A0A428X2L4_AMYBA|nr:SDR family oxidoreductase [Amycolatopsis balhimycina]RSM49530.1 SDR family NAD(P)-dependent oxidoreductase [Amycolatopsis balhimycina DSM 5908]